MVWEWYIWNGPGGRSVQYQWKTGFSNPESTALRKAGGAKSYQIFCTEDDPNHLVVLIEWNTLDNAREYYQSDKFRKAQKSSGVLGPPEMYFLKEVEKGSD